jgi:hypothetical protein
MSLQTYFAFGGPALVVLAGAMILGIGWLFTRDRHPKAGE